RSVIIELKRGSHKLQLLQAVSYAGMISRWPAQNFIDTLAQSSHQSADEAQSTIEDHTSSEISSINHAQRILLIAEDFDPALLVSAEWLHEKYDVDIRCYRLQLSQEDGTDYLTCTCICPPIEIATLTRGPRAGAGTDWPDWNSALQGIDNTAVKDFYRAELGQNRESRLQTGSLIYRFDGKRRFRIRFRQKFAHVRQFGRFNADDVYWRQLVSEPNQVQQVRAGEGL